MEHDTRRVHGLYFEHRVKAVAGEAIYIVTETRDSSAHMSDFLTVEQVRELAKALMDAVDEAAEDHEARVAEYESFAGVERFAGLDS